MNKTKFAALEKDLGAFIDFSLKLAPGEWIGVARILGVQVEELCAPTNKPIPRDAETVFEEMLEKFLAMNRKRRKNLLKIMKAAVSK